MTKKQTIKGWMCSQSGELNLYLMTYDDKITWTNSMIEAKKWETKKEVLDFIQHNSGLKKFQYSNLESCIPLFIEISGYY